MHAMAGETLYILSGGAAQGLVKALQARFVMETGAAVEGRFGAVGAMKEALLAGQPCDLMIVTAAMVDGLVAEGRLAGAGRADLGRVATGVAVKAGAPLPDVSTPEALRAALLAAGAVYVPDTQRATAGIHVAKVLTQLGVAAELAPRLREFPAGAVAMRELAASTEPAPIGVTQVTEILYTPGVRLVGRLPKAFELSTVYTAAPVAGSPRAALAARFIALLAGVDAQALREAGGFDA